MLWHHCEVHVYVGQFSSTYLFQIYSNMLQAVHVWCWSHLKMPRHIHIGKNMLVTRCNLNRGCPRKHKCHCMSKKSSLRIPEVKPCFVCGFPKCDCDACFTRKNKATDLCASPHGFVSHSVWTNSIQYYVGSRVKVRTGAGIVIWVTWNELNWIGLRCIELNWI